MLVLPGDDEARKPSERRILGVLARFDLRVVERLAVLRDQRAHHRMLGLVGLQIAAADTGIAPGAPDHLMQQLEGALGGARIAVGETEIGVDDADQVELREVMAFGDQLRADDDVEAALRHVVQFLAQALHRGDQIAGQHKEPRLRKQRAHFFFQALDARPDGGERIRRLAVRARGRMRRGEAAVMTNKLPAEAVIDQPGVAMRAGEAIAAGAAERQRRVAAAIKEEQRLLAPLDRSLYRTGQRRGNEAAGRRPLATQVDRLDRRHELTAEALGQRQPPVAPAAAH